MLAFLLPAVLASPKAAAEDPLTLIAFGDSLTQGYGLPPEEGFVPVLDRWLAAEGISATVVNAGVSGDTTAGGRARIGWTLSGAADAVIVALGANDMLRGIDPGVSKANLAGILEIAKDADLPVLLIGFEAAGNYGPDYKAAFDGMYAELASDYDTLFFPSFFRPLVGEGSGPLDANLMQSDGLHPNRAGVAVVAAALGPSVAELARDATKSKSP
ncbi:MAG: arylesterase [Pseudomonadota bacterium]